MCGSGNATACCIAAVGMTHRGGGIPLVSRRSHTANNNVDNLINPQQLAGRRAPGARPVI